MTEIDKEQNQKPVHHLLWDLHSFCYFCCSFGMLFWHVSACLQPGAEHIGTPQTMSETVAPGFFPVNPGMCALEKKQQLNFGHPLVFFLWLVWLHTVWLWCSDLWNIWNIPNRINRINRDLQVSWPLRRHRGLRLHPLLLISGHGWRCQQLCYDNYICIMCPRLEFIYCIVCFVLSGMIYHTMM